MRIPKSALGREKMNEIIYVLLKDMINPVALAWLLLFVAALFSWFKKKRGLAVAFLVMWAVIWVFGTLHIGSKLLGDLEKPYRGLTWEEIPEADAIVVLGGGWAPSSNDLIGFNASFAADRFLTGLELFRKGKSKLILIGGGAAEIEDGKPGDSIHMADWMKSFSLDGAEAIALPACHNTREEALRVKEVIEKRGGGKILLVTSAWHMRRSAAVFKGVGLDIFPVPCDFEMSSLAESASKKPNLVPGLEQLVFLNLYLHEWVGWHFYKMKGWIH